MSSSTSANIDYFIDTFIYFSLSHSPIFFFRVINRRCDPEMRMWEPNPSMKYRAIKMRKPTYEDEIASAGCHVRQHFVQQNQSNTFQNLFQILLPRIITVMTLHINIENGFKFCFCVGT